MRNPLTGLLARVHQWRNVIICLLDLLYGVTEKQTVCLEVGQSVLESKRLILCNMR